MLIPFFTVSDLKKYVFFTVLDILNYVLFFQAVCLVSLISFVIELVFTCSYLFGQLKCY